MTAKEMYEKFAEVTRASKPMPFEDLPEIHRDGWLAVAAVGNAEDEPVKTAQYALISDLRLEVNRLRDKNLDLVKGHDEWCRAAMDAGFVLGVSEFGVTVERDPRLASKIKHHETEDLTEKLAEAQATLDRHQTLANEVACYFVGYPTDEEDMRIIETVTVEKAIHELKAAVEVQRQGNSHLVKVNEALKSQLTAKYKNSAVTHLKRLSADIHEVNRKWWVDLITGEPITRNVGELLMLTVTELAEGLEGHRKNLMDDHLPMRSMLEVELADCVIRCLDIGAGFALDVPGALLEKLEYNRT